MEENKAGGPPFLYFLEDGRMSDFNNQPLYLLEDFRPATALRIVLNHVCLPKGNNKEDQREFNKVVRNCLSPLKGRTVTVILRSWIEGTVGKPFPGIPEFTARADVLVLFSLMFFLNFKIIIFY